MNFRQRLLMPTSPTIFYLTDFLMEFDPKEELQYLFKCIITKNSKDLLKIKLQNIEQSNIKTTNTVKNA